MHTRPGLCIAIVIVAGGCAPAPAPRPLSRAVAPADAGSAVAVKRDAAPPPVRIVLDGDQHRIGSDPPPPPVKPPSNANARFALGFAAAANPGEETIIVHHRATRERWKVLLNGAPIGYLRTRVEVSHVTVAPGALSGRNDLEITSELPKNALEIRSIELDHRPVGELLALGQVHVKVVNRDTQAPVPARITITDESGTLMEPYHASGSSPIAVRQGVVYTLGDEVSFDLPEGSYRVYASRGMEWGMDTATVPVARGETHPLSLTIAREVNTPGFIAADTHLHTQYTTIDERLLTLAGEGVEFAVATDHNHNTDYGPAHHRLGLSEHFHSVTGNEVTTAIGHINGFPLNPEDQVPDFRLRDIVKIVESIREKGARVVILNHPRWPNVETGIFGKMALDQLTGDAARGFKVTFDAMELANPNQLESEPMTILADWFALLNRGERVTAIGASDTHTVEDPPGSARTFLRSRTDDPKAIDAEEIYRSILEGRGSVSIGILADVEVDGRFRPGDTAPVKGRSVTVKLRVAAPSWIRPLRAVVFVNGRRRAEQAIEAGPGEPTDVTLTIPVKLEGTSDAHLVAVALGEQAPKPHKWAWKYTMGATNPVFLDVDRDGSYSSPRETARRFLRRRQGQSWAQLQRALQREDPVVAAQALSFLRADVGTLLDAQAARITDGPRP